MLATENKIDINDIIYPMFVKQGINGSEEISSMPGIFRFSLEALVDEIRELERLGIKKVLLFGIPDKKDWIGSYAQKDTSIVCEAVKAIKANISTVKIMTDICLCAYTTHGHCGIIQKGHDKIEKQETLESLALMALSHAKAGADYVAPSAMAAGQVMAIKKALEDNGFGETGIMGYSAKFASNFYGPFREAADSAPKFGNRSSYQLGVDQKEVALDKIKQDIEQGADIVMVKPALGYLDIIKEAKDQINVPLAVYNVSGEYSMVKQGVQSGFWKERDMVFEIMNSFKRAGADHVISYHAKDIAKWMER